MNTNDTAPLTAEVVAEMIRKLRHYEINAVAFSDHDLLKTASGQLECATMCMKLEKSVLGKAADMLTALTAQLAERDAELAESKDNFERMYQLCLSAQDKWNAAIGKNLTANRRIAALTEALTFCELADETPGGIIRCAARAALTTDKEPTT